nr:ABC transporter substrate-binding protein [uncultured Gemmiger sp.]
MKKAIALALAGAMSVGLLAGCGSNGAASTGSAQASGETSAASGEGGLSISWWGGDSRHTAYQNALAAFTEETGIQVATHYGAWSGWEDQTSAALYSGNAEDVMQVNWNWLSQYSGDGSKFVDLNEYSDIIDLSQFPQSTLDACTVAGKLQAIPVSMTGRIFYWNMNTFKEAGIEEVPSTLDDLYAAGEAFQTKLGDDYYPLALGEYDRMLLMTFYLESNYGKPWVEDNTLQYTVDEIATGIDFIQSLEDKHVIPSLQTMNAAGIDGNNSIDKSEQWINGMYAGIFEWDSAATKYKGSLADPSGFTVGNEIKFGDKANGGFSKVSMGLAITETCKDKESAAKLINFLLNGDGAAIMGSECGIPNSAAGLAAAESAGAVDSLVLEANTKVMEFVDFQLDPTYESNDLKANPGGVYTDVFGGYSYGEYTDSTEAATDLYDGVTEALEDAAKG